MARGGDPLRQKGGIILGRLPTPGSDDLEQTLLTTLPSPRWYQMPIPVELPETAASADSQRRYTSLLRWDLPSIQGALLQW